MTKYNIIRHEYYENSLITDAESLVNNIPKIESLFRNSKLYKNYIAGIREGLQIQNCDFFKDKDFTEVPLELHHIFQLYNIVLIVGMKMLDELEENGFYTVYDIVNEVVKFHMKDYPVVMMLSSTIHALYHTGQYILSPNSKQFHSGRYREFITEYRDYLDQKETIELYKYYGIDVGGLFNENT